MRTVETSLEEIFKQHPGFTKVCREFGWGKRKPSAAIRERLLEYFPEYTFDDLFIIEESGDGG